MNSESADGALEVLQEHAYLIGLAPAPVWNGLSLEQVRPNIRPYW